MRSPLRKELFVRFERELHGRFPQFTFFEKDPATRSWRWTFAPGLTFFLFLQTFRDRDQFTIEVAWSEDGQFPWEVVAMTKIDQPKGRDRLAWLWDKSPGTPVWDLDPDHSARVREHLKSLSTEDALEYPPDSPAEKLLPRLEPLVADAIDKFEQFGMPLFRQVIEARGLSLTA